MKNKILIQNVIKYILFFGVGIGIFIWVFRDQKIASLYSGLSEFKYGWIIASLGIGLLSHFLRALRWRMLIESIGFKPRVLNTFLSILVMYLANFALPRMGEVTRCGILKKYEGVPFTSLLGTVIIERIVDFMFLLLMLISVIMIEWDVLASTLKHDGNGFESKNSPFLGSPWFLGLAVFLFLVSILGMILRKRLMQSGLVQKCRFYLVKFTEGLKSVLHLRNPYLFVLLTIGIYGCYYLLTWFVMISFAPTAQLSPIVALVVLSFGSVGMVLPVQGGIGTFHALVVYALMLYGISENDRTLIALVLHGSTTVFLIFIGAIALVLLPVVNREKTIL